MNDFNFFDPYIDKRSIKMDKRLTFYTVILLAIGIVIIYFIFTQIQIRRLSEDINNLKEIVEDEKIISKVDKIENKESELQVLKNSIDEVNMFSDFMDNSTNIDNPLLETITSRIPEEVFFTSMSMYTTHIEIVGKSSDQLSIARLTKNLEDVDEFESVFVSSISKEDLYYNFAMNINLKEVNMDGSTEEMQTQENTDE